jgi:dynein heavy chain
MGLEGNEAAALFKDIVDTMKNTVPIVGCLRDQTLEERHWEEINAILNVEVDIHSPEFTLRSLIDLELSQEDRESICDIALRASKEAELLNLFKKVQNDWKNVQFEVTQYKESKEYYVISSTEEVMEVLEVCMVGISTILTSRFGDHIRKEVEDFNTKNLRKFEMLIDEWMEFQKGWTYLESIFHSSDISRNLPNETKKFNYCDQSWKNIMRDINHERKCYKAVNNPKENLLETFRQNNKILDEIQKALNQYLEEKRKAFSRFFFLSNNELLLILAEANRNPEAVQPHLRKLFENINRIVMGVGVNAENITKIQSAEEEELTLARPPKTREPVEKWMKELEGEMVRTLKNIIKNSLNDYVEDEGNKKAKLKLLSGNILQAAITIDSINWCAMTEDVLRNDYIDAALEWWLTEIKESLELLTDIIRKDLTLIERRTIICLMTQDVHYRDIIAILKDEPTSVDGFLWQQQLRYYMNEDKEKGVYIKQLNSTIDYGYEYLGAATRLVITPLTDRCWITITSALNIKLGAAPAGPAGTGKTESTKDLAKGLGKFCVVFN